MNNNERSQSAWPIFIWILAILYFITYLISFFCNTFATRMSSHTIPRYILSQSIYIIAALLIPILFAAPTKKIAPITSLPAVILVVTGLVTVTMMLMRGHVPPIHIIYNTAGLALDFLLVTLYLIQMFARTRWALPITYTVIFAGYMLFQVGFRAYFTFNNVRYAFMPSMKVLNISSFVFYLMSILSLGAVYCSATFAVRKEKE